jgi:hypothetical protein
MNHNNRLLSLIRHGPHWKWRVQQFFYCSCAFVITVTFLPSLWLAMIRGFLPSRCLATIRGLLSSRCLATIRGIHGHTHKQQRDLISLLYFFSLLSYFEKYSRLMRSCCCLCVSPPPSLLGNGSVKVSFSLLANGYVFYAVHVVSKESRRLVLPRTSCFQNKERRLKKRGHILVSILTFIYISNVQNQLPSLASLSPWFI